MDRAEIVVPRASGEDIFSRFMGKMEFGNKKV
jgi:hypothetical protein